MITIMVIDNSAQLEQSLRQLLTDAHIDAMIHCAADSKEAFRFLESGGKPEIIFSDIDQPTPIIVTSAPLVSFADGATVEDLSTTGYAIPNGTAANSTLAVTDGKGLNGKSAITVAINEDAGYNVTGDWWFVSLKNLPSTVATVNTDAFTSILPGTTAADLMIWFYIDGTALTEDARLNFGLSTNDGDTLGTAAYRYTQEKQYYIDAFGKVQSIYLGSNTNSNGFVSTNARGRVTIEAGVGNWIGIPVNRFGSGDVTSLHNIRFSLVRGADRDGTGTQPILHAGDSLSIGDIWLTTKDEEGNWVIPEPAAEGLLSEEYYTADDYLADSTLFTPVWGSTYSVPAEMLDWNEKFNSFYDPEGKTSGDGLALVASGGNGGAATATGYARIRLDTGWSGWIGIPVENFCGNNTPVPTDNVAIIRFRTLGVIDNSKGTETIYFDEFWLTEAGKMPNLSNAQLLYVGD